MPLDVVLGDTPPLPLPSMASSETLASSARRRATGRVARGAGAGGDGRAGADGCRRFDGAAAAGALRRLSRHWPLPAHSHRVDLERASPHLHHVALGGQDLLDDTGGGRGISASTLSVVTSTSGWSTSTHVADLHHPAGDRSLDDALTERRKLDCDRHVQLPLSS